MCEPTSDLPKRGNDFLGWRRGIVKDVVALKSYCAVKAASMATIACGRPVTSTLSSLPEVPT